MKRLLLALPLILIGSPALAEKWVTVATGPIRPNNPEYFVGYQIDVDSIRIITFGDDTLIGAYAKWTYKDDIEKVVAECSKSRLRANAGMSGTPWVKRDSEGDWYLDDGLRKGEPFAETAENKYLVRRWFSGAFDLLCG